ncbi:MAG: dimethyl sulfoxide reductase anchor subunit family protein, partial [Gammaproteobacteria bacterium]
MRPTFSIILFTVLSGIGYGLWFLIGIGLLLLWPESYREGGLVLDRWPCLLHYGLVTGFVLVSSGLISSLGHLGKPGRAWRAFSHWRSSWLSREGVAAVLTYVPVAGFAMVAIHDSWLIREARLGDGAMPASWSEGSVVYVLGALLVVGSLLTVFCTANIYACLKPVRAWNNRYVPVGYLMLAVHGGGLCAWALTTLPHAQLLALRFLLAEVALTAIATAFLKWHYWRFIDRDSTLTTGDATGLRPFGTVRSFEQPHTEENYLTHEMGFLIARKHSRKLQRIALVAGFIVPAVCAMLA